MSRALFYYGTGVSTYLAIGDSGRQEEERDQSSNNILVQHGIRESICSATWRSCQTTGRERSE
eukprot:scaffold9267_cov80-Skeletonema_dohrnii-CCMP3373.AAC.2